MRTGKTIFLPRHPSEERLETLAIASHLITSTADTQAFLNITKRLEPTLSRVSFVISDGANKICCRRRQRYRGSRKSWAGSNAGKGQERTGGEHDVTTEKPEDSKKDLDQWLADENNRGNTTKWDEQVTSQCPKGSTSKQCQQSEWLQPDHLRIQGEYHFHRDTQDALDQYDEYVKARQRLYCSSMSPQRGKHSTSVDGIPACKCDGDIYWFYRGQRCQPTLGTRNAAKQQKLLNTTHSGTVELRHLQYLHMRGRNY